MATIHDQLCRALELTDAALAAAVTPEGALHLLGERQPLVDGACAQREAGEPWGQAERELARRLQDADARLVEQLWRPHAGAFAWLAGRRPELGEELPQVASLAAGDVAAGRGAEARGAGHRAIERYRTVRRGR